MQSWADIHRIALLEVKGHVQLHKVLKAINLHHALHQATSRSGLLCGI